MKKLIIAALVAVTAVSSVISVSAVCGNCPNGECINSGYCVEECPNNYIPQCDGTGMQRRIGKGACHGRRRWCDNAYCMYR